jgi:Domain of unknown function (DUF4345)
MIKKKKLIGLRIVLGLVGLYIILSGINIAVGGMPTLGLGGQSNFFKVTDMPPYLIQDSHIRFVGGVWLGLGLLFLLSTTNPLKYKPYLLFGCVLIFIGGLSRLFQAHPEITFGKNIIGPFLAEIIGTPILFTWISKTVK